jgi:hypothetical protein
LLVVRTASIPIVRTTHLKSVLTATSGYKPQTTKVVSVQRLIELRRNSNGR